ncbi:MAG TPA: NAD(P)H-dependent glycerol-3-phosphate dehydrogenase [Candidatus Cryosericum sp.]|nr:NAD(P)H-dependent glycerol-3-phosphate dehydrogenase [Candidatus Cryosericum sp.]
MNGAAVLGAGSWGTALAIHLARNGSDTTLWARRQEAARALQEERSNADYLKGYPFPDRLAVTGDLEEALRGRRLVLLVMPAQWTRPIVRQAAPFVDADADVLVASKGIEQASGLRLTEVLRQEAPGSPLGRAGVLSGPSFALEVARGDPTAIVAASRDDAAMGRVQAVLSAGNLRVYRNGDPIGVELAGALKNVMAIASGIVEGLGLGLNTRAALITRGLVEMTRLGVALGGRAGTFAGLAGAGDLILTCTGGLSRNRALGVEIGRGRRLEEILRGARSVAEGVATTRAATELARRQGVEMPIAGKVEEVLFGDLPPRAAVEDLLSRPLREET